MSEERQLSWPHFAAWELACKCSFDDCQRHGMDPEYMARLVDFRRAWGKPMVLNSAYRCPWYNRLRSKTGVSGPHVTGRATDVRIAGNQVYDFVALAMEHGFTGIGLNQKGAYSGRFVHLDDLTTEVNPVTGIAYPRPFIWTY